MKKVRCPICERPMDGRGPREWPQWPFCSPRCRTIDLGRWLGGSYRIEGPSTGEDPGADDEEASPSIPAVPSAVPHKEEA